MRVQHYLALLLVLFPLLIGCGKSADLLAADKPADRAALDARLKLLLADRVKTAKKAYDATLAAFQADTVTLGELVTATDNLWTAEVAVAIKPADLIAAHKRHVEHFWQMEQKIEALYLVGVRGGEAEKYATARYNLESAEIALLEVCVGTGLPYPLDVAPDLPADPAEEP